MWRILILAAACAWSCNGVHYDKPLAHSSPLLRSDWRPLIPRRTSTIDYEPPASERSTAAGTTAVPPDVRAAMVAGANELLADERARDEYGAEDVERALRRAVPGLAWSASQGLDRLVAEARRAGAFATGGDPRAGDVVLFHNLLDANGNGKIDDWNTGCGIVIEERPRRRFVAAVRTGHAPRRALVWPDGPARRVLDGRPVNSFLRVPHPSDPADTPYLAGQLYAGHIDVVKLADATASR